MFFKYSDTILKVLAFVFSILAIHLLFNKGEIVETLEVGGISYILLFLHYKCAEERERRERAAIVVDELADRLEEEYKVN